MVVQGGDTPAGAGPGHRQAPGGDFNSRSARPQSGRVGMPLFSRVSSFPVRGIPPRVLSPQSPRIWAVALGWLCTHARAPRGVSGPCGRQKPLRGTEIPMTQHSSRRAIICPDCGKYVLAGSRGPLPTRCRQCRAWRRRPILPERLAGKTTCSRCGATVPVTGRRGRLPQFCRVCRGESANAKRRNGPPISGLLTPEDWDPYLPPPLKW
jgi:hypothetical protein